MLCDRVHHAKNSNRPPNLSDRSARASREHLFLPSDRGHGNGLRGRSERQRALGELEVPNVIPSGGGGFLEFQGIRRTVLHDEKVDFGAVLVPVIVEGGAEAVVPVALQEQESHFEEYFIGFSPIPRDNILWVSSAFIRANPRPMTFMRRKHEFPNRRADQSFGNRSEQRIPSKGFLSAAQPANPEFHRKNDVCLHRRR